MMIRMRELKPGDLIAIDPLGGIAKPLHRENIKYDLYFVFDVQHDGRSRFGGSYTIRTLTTVNGTPHIQEFTNYHGAPFTDRCIPLQFQGAHLYLSDPIPEYSE
jgi:hypothetical protein